MSLWAGPVERFVPNSVGAKNDRWSRITQASLHDSIPYGARITVEFHKLRLISIVDESLTCKLNAVDLYAMLCSSCCCASSSCRTCLRLHTYKKKNFIVKISTLKNLYKVHHSAVDYWGRSTQLKQHKMYYTQTHVVDWQQIESAQMNLYFAIIHLYKL